MSLLLQALQKAAKNREAGATPVELPASASEPPAAESLEPPPAILPAAFAVEAQPEGRPAEPELTLAEEDLFEPEEVPGEAAERFEPFGPAPAAASPADAAAILRAGETPTASWIDFVRDRPVVAVLIGAIVFGAF